jgi:hypothetical protein
MFTRRDIHLVTPNTDIIRGITARLPRLHRNKLPDYFLRLTFGPDAQGEAFL